MNRLSRGYRRRRFNFWRVRCIGNFRSTPLRLPINDSSDWRILCDATLAFVSLLNPNTVITAFWLSDSMETSQVSAIPMGNRRDWETPEGVPNPPCPTLTLSNPVFLNTIKLTVDSMLPLFVTFTITTLDTWFKLVITPVEYERMVGNLQSPFLWHLVHSMRIRGCNPRL